MAGIAAVEGFSPDLRWLYASYGFFVASYLFVILGLLLLVQRERLEKKAQQPQAAIAAHKGP
jgi:hypothetical protein